MLFRSLVAILSVGALAGPAWGLVVHNSKAVTVVHSPDHRECLFFRLDGVTEADAAVPGNPWFAVPKTHPGYKEILAALMMARATGAPLQHVATTGGIACDHAAVGSVSF